MGLFTDKKELYSLSNLPINYEEMYKVIEEKKHIELDVFVPYFKKILDSKEIVLYMSKIFVLSDREIMGLSNMRRKDLRNLFYTLKSRFEKIKYMKKK
jgi:hypothetical protein